MITSSHEEVIWKESFPCKKSNYDFYWEWSSVDEVSIKQVSIVLRRIAIEFENVEQIVELTMDISTHCDLLVVRNIDVDKTLIFLENLSASEDNHEGELLVKFFTLA